MAVGSNFGRFFDDSNLDQIEGFINGILSTPDIPKEDDNERVSSDFLSKVFEKDSDKNELDQLFSKFNVPTDRLLRYASYDEIYRSVSMIKRIVKVYKTNIIQKNPVNSLWYLLRKTEYAKDKNIEAEQKSDLSKEYIENFIKSFNILGYLKDLYLHNMLIYGDCFVEVIDLKKEKEKVDIKKISLLNETDLINLKTTVDKYNGRTQSVLINDAIDSIAESLYIITDDVIEKPVDEAKANEKENSDLEQKRFENVLLRFHKPHNIIILETKYGTKLGYLEVSKTLEAQSNNITQTLSSITNRIASISSDSQGSSITSRDAILNRIAQHILKKVTNSKTKFDDEVIESFKRFIIEQNLNNQQINLKPVEVRFIPISRMVPFNFPSSDNYPYGGSIIDILMLPGKLFILSQLSNIYMKLSRAPLNRKWIRIS